MEIDNAFFSLRSVEIVYFGSSSSIQSFRQIHKLVTKLQRRLLSAHCQIWPWSFFLALKMYFVEMSSLVTIFKCLPHPFCRMIILSLFQLSRFDHSLFMQKKYLKFLILLIASAFVHLFCSIQIYKSLIFVPILWREMS